MCIIRDKTRAQKYTHNYGPFPFQDFTGVVPLRLSRLLIRWGVRRVAITQTSDSYCYRLQWERTTLCTSTFCFTSTEATWLIRDGDRGRKCEGSTADTGRPEKTGETVDRRQNNGSVKAVSLCHCPATSALRNCCFNCRAWAESQRQCPLHCS